MTAPHKKFVIREQDLGKNPDRREDLLVSVCFGDLPADAAAFDKVAELAQQLDARFRFREIIVVTEEARLDALLGLVQQVANLRLITVRNGTPFYRRRVIAADEAIGDVVMIANASELSLLNPVAMVEQAAKEQQIVLAVRTLGLVDRTLAKPLVSLGRLAGFKVDLHDLQTMVMPRTLLNQLLAHPDPDLALRFPPRDLRIPLAFFSAALDMPTHRRSGNNKERLALLQRLIVYIAPGLLMAVTISSAILAIIGLVYAFYVIGAWIIVDNLEPGWLTLSVMLSLTAQFLGVSIMGLSLGLQQLLTRAENGGFDDVASEINRIDLFGQVAMQLNVDVERDAIDLQERAER